MRPAIPHRSKNRKWPHNGPLPFLNQTAPQPVGSIGSPSKTVLSSAGERPPRSLGAPADPGYERKTECTKNHIDLIGFIGSDLEARQTSNGTAVTTFSLATKSSWKNESGAYDSRTEWHRIVLWGKLADAAAKLAKGAYVQVEGELRHRSYQKEIPAGKKAVAIDIPVTEVHARVLRKLDHSATPAESEITEEAPE